MYEVYLKKNEEKRILAGHSWVYANEVARIEGKDKNGSIARVLSADGRFLGRGFINHVSKILVRIFIRNDAEEPTKEFFTERIRRANEYRKKLGYDNCYRAVFAEADDLPALIVDKYGDILSCQFLSLGMDKMKETIVESLIEVFSPRGIYERSDVSVRDKEGLLQTKGILYGNFDPTRVEIVENGLKMLVDVENGQKTGYFLDQKENRLAIRRYSENAEVLDCFCNSGGFSLNAARGGARSVIACDISSVALDEVKRNAEANGITAIETLQADVFEALREFKRAGRKFDLIVLDPPAFAKSADSVKDAYRGYKDINLLAMKLVREGGFLATASCSHYMTFPLFEKMLVEAAAQSGRNVRAVEQKSQAPDHPSLLCAEETQYLKFFVLNIN